MRSTRTHTLTAENVKTTKTRFDTAANALRWIALTGLRLLLQFWYSRQPMFWIPQGWVPGYIEWILAFPRAPTGSISMQVWWIACTTVIAMVGQAVVAIYTLVVRHTQQGSAKKQPMAYESTSAKTADSRTEKKEL